MTTPVRPASAPAAASPARTGASWLPGDPDPRQQVERAIRVDHAGEVGAVRIYEGQLAALRWTGRAGGENAEEGGQCLHRSVFVQSIRQWPSLPPKRHDPEIIRASDRAEPAACVVRIARPRAALARLRIEHVRCSNESDARALGGRHRDVTEHALDDLAIFVAGHRIERAFRIGVCARMRVAHACRRRGI